MRYRDGAGLWRRGERPVLRHGDTEKPIRTLNTSLEQAIRPKGESQYLRTYQARAAMGLPLSAVKIRHLTEKTTLTRLSNKL